MPDKHALVLGGAGFVGSHIVATLVNRGYSVTCVDGLVPGTGGRADNLLGIPRVEILFSRVEDTDNLPELVSAATVVVDCLGWTAHLAALRDPRRDVELNIESHVPLLQAATGGAFLIYLGSRSQFGRWTGGKIPADAAMVPEDVHGVTKAAAEGLFRIYAALKGLSVISLRLPGVIGERQPTSGELGLVGGFISELAADGTVEVYGTARRRSLAYAGDVAAVVAGLADKGCAGFTPLNFDGSNAAIHDIALTLRDIVGRGKVNVKSVPHEIAAIDVGNAPMDEEELTALLGEVDRTEMRIALERASSAFVGAMR